MKRLFGTDGIRGIVGELMTPVFGAEMGMAIGTFLGKGKIVIASAGIRTHEYFMCYIFDSIV